MCRIGRIDVLGLRACQISSQNRFAQKTTGHKRIADSIGMRGNAVRSKVCGARDRFITAFAVANIRALCSSSRRVQSQHSLLGCAGNMLFVLRNSLLLAGNNIVLALNSPHIWRRVLPPHCPRGSSPLGCRMV